MGRAVAEVLVVIAAVVAVAMTSCSCQRRPAPGPEAIPFPTVPGDPDVAPAAGPDEATRAILTARVTQAGTAVPGARVLLSDGGPDVRDALADDDGRATFDDLTPGAYELWAESENRVSPLARVTRAAGAGEEIELVLAAGATVRGRALAEGADLSGATATLVP